MSHTNNKECFGGMAVERLIATLSYDERRILDNYLEHKTAPTGSLLIKQNSINQDLLFIYAGDFEVYKKFRLSDKSVGIKIATFSAPILFGEMNFILEDKRTAAVLVTSSAEYCILSKNNFDVIKHEHPSIAIKILEYSTKIAAIRFIELEQTLHEKLIQCSSNSEDAYKRINQYLGNTTLSTPSIVEKIFNLGTGYPEVS